MPPRSPPPAARHTFRQQRLAARDHVVDESFLCLSQIVLAAHARRQAVDLSVLGVCRQQGARQELETPEIVLLQCSGRRTLQGLDEPEHERIEISAKQASSAAARSAIRILARRITTASNRSFFGSKW